MKPNNYEGILQSFPKKNVLVIGDLMLDHFIWGKVNRISPEAPVPVVEVTHESRMPGGAANVATNLASLDIKTFVIGFIGEDSEGDQLLSLLDQSNISHEGIVRTKERHTTKKSRVIAHHQQVVRVDRDFIHPSSDEETQSILEKISMLIPQVDAVILEDYGKGLIHQSLINQVIKKCREHLVPLSVDPKRGSYYNLSGATMCSPNLHEARDLAKYYGFSIQSLPEDGERLRNELKVDQLLITLGEDGMMLFMGSHSPLHIETKAQEVFDVSGAGDTVIATYSAALAAQAAPNDAAFLANLAGSIVVGKLGTATVSRDELLDHLKKNDS